MLTSVESVFKTLNNGRASAQSINAFFLICLLGFQVLNTSEDDGWEISDSDNVQRFLQRDTKYGSWGI
jgi:hypothetical protein